MRTTPVRDRRAPESRELRYVFNGHPVRTGPELVEAMRRDWQAAGDLLAGRVDPGLEEWLRTRPGGDDVVRELRLETSGGARLIRLQAALDPGGPLMFQGREVTDASLDRAIRAANSWTPDAAGETDQCHRWLTGIRREQILKAMAAVVEGDTAERLGAADQRLRTWSRQTRDVLDRIPEKEERTVAEGAESACLGLLFSVALGATGPEDSHRRVMAAVSNRDTAGAPWAEDLAARVLRSAPGDLGLVIPAAAVISAVTADNRAHRARREAEEASRRRREEERRRREAAARASAAQDRRNRRRRALIGQLCLRIPTSLAYSAFAGTSLTAAVSHPHEPNWGLWWPNTLPVLGACCVTVALACLLDWLLDSPRGGCRYPVGGIGLGIGVWGRYPRHRGSARNGGRSGDCVQHSSPHGGSSGPGAASSGYCGRSYRASSRSSRVPRLSAQPREDHYRLGDRDGLMSTGRDDTGPTGVSDGAGAAGTGTGRGAFGPMWSVSCAGLTRMGGRDSHEDAVVVLGAAAPATSCPHPPGCCAPSWTAWAATREGSARPASPPWTWPASTRPTGARRR